MTQNMENHNWCIRSSAGFHYFSDPSIGTS
jgi:hypothetical protein